MGGRPAGFAPGAPGTPGNPATGAPLPFPVPCPPPGLFGSPGAPPFSLGRRLLKAWFTPAALPLLSLGTSM